MSGGIAHRRLAQRPPDRPRRASAPTCVREPALSRRCRPTVPSPLVAAAPRRPPRPRACGRSSRGRRRRASVRAARRRRARALRVERPDDVGEADARRRAGRRGLRRRRAARRSASSSAAMRARSSSLRGIAWTLGRPISAFSAAGVPSATMLAVVDDPDAVGEDVGLLEVLGREEHRDAVLAGEARHLVPERRAALRVEAGRRLVEEEDARPVDEREREVEPPLHAARVAADLAVGRLGEADALEQLLRRGLALGLREPLQHRLQPQVVAAGEQRVERRLLERGADHAAHLRALRARRRSPPTRGGARGRRQERREHRAPSSTCRRRSARGSRRSRRARRGGRSRRPRAGPS